MLKHDPLSNTKMASFDIVGVSAESKMMAEFRNRSTYSFVTAAHKNAISKVCGKKYYISIRETGDCSIKRIEKGAKAKPHSILDKSIKLSSLQSAYGDEAGEKIFNKLKEINLDGFVGKWENNKLIGIRTGPGDEDNNYVKLNITVGVINNNIQSMENENIIKIDNDIVIDITALNKHKSNDKNSWEKSFYTGDYDLHEVYLNKAQIREGSDEIISFLNKINREISNQDPIQNRTGVASNLLERNASQIHVQGDYAMFQHGPQATYEANQLLVPDVKTKSEAHINPVVAKQDSGKLAWCIDGEWYVTNDINEHKALRNYFKLVAPSSWLEQDKHRSGGGKGNVKYSLQNNRPASPKYSNNIG